MESSKLCSYKAFFDRFAVEFVYLKKGSVLHAPSTLYARIYPRKEEMFFFLTHEIKHSMEPSCLESFMIPYIENEEQMESCAEHLIKTIEGLMPLLEEWDNEDDAWQLAKKRKCNELFRLFKVKEGDAPVAGDLLQEWLLGLCAIHEQNVLLPRFSSKESPYLRLSAGKTEKAKKQYEKLEKKNNLTALEASLLEELKKGRESFPLFVSSDGTPSDLMTLVSFAGEGKLYLSCILTAWLLFSLLFCGILLFLGLLFSLGAVYWAGMPWPFGFLLGGLCAVFGGLALRRKIIPLVYRKNAQRVLTADKLINGKGVTVFANVCFALVFTCCMVLVLILPFDAVSFYEERVSFPASDVAFLTLPESVSYQEISAVYQLEGRYNDYDEYIPFGSYVLCFRDGTQLDLYGYVSMEDTKSYVLPLIAPFSGEIIQVHSDRDLP